ncbi:MAG TPA: hypothetical protein VNZ45_02615 [Bacteroidia bacterium]|jgi:hypothetical protein|nr:hypothetical protein [Bacteroidia bacterium]
MAEIQPGYAGVYIPSTNVWDVSNVENANIDDPALKELLIRLYQNLNDMALAVNLKSSGYFVTQQFVNSELFFPNPSLTSASSTTPTFRQVIREVVNFGALPNSTTKTYLTDILTNSAIRLTRIYGCATNPSTGSIPLPYSSTTLANNIELKVDTGVNMTDGKTYERVSITTAFNYSAYTTTYVILEYITS